MDEEGDSDATRAAGPPPLELVQSYAAFALRAIRKRLSLTILIFVGIAGIALGLLAVWPRSYSCQMKLMVQSNPMLVEKELDPLSGSTNLIRRHDNLKAIVQRVELVKNWDLQRPPLLRVKDRIRERLRGKMPESAMTDTLVATLSGALWVDVEDRSLTIGVHWPNPEMAARIVETAKDTYIESRHLTEIAAIQEKMAIWDGHASSVRGEINRIVEQLQRLREAQIAKAHKTAEELTVAAPIAPAAIAVAPRRPVAVIEPMVDPQLPSLKEELQNKKQRLSELEGEYNQRIRDTKTKIASLKTDLTPEHPLVLQAQRVLEMQSVPSAELSSLRTDVKSLSEDIKSREEATRVSVPTGATAGASAPAAAAPRAAKSVTTTPELLPSRVLELLESGRRNRPDREHPAPERGQQVHGLSATTSPRHGSTSTRRKPPSIIVTRSWFPPRCRPRRVNRRCPR